MTRWDGQRATFEGISERHGIVNRPFGGNLLEDGRGRIWTQMYVYDPATDRLDELTAADGADLGTGWFQAHAKRPTADCCSVAARESWWSGRKHFDASAYAPPLLISELSINGQRQSAGRIRDGLVVPAQRSFSLAVAALDYSDPAACAMPTSCRVSTPTGRTPRPIPASPATATWTLATISCACVPPTAAASGVRTNWPSRCACTARLVANLVVPSSPAGLAAMMVYALVHLRTRHLRLRQIELERTVHERTPIWRNWRWRCNGVGRAQGVEPDRSLDRLAQPPLPDPAHRGRSRPGGARVREPPALRRKPARRCRAGVLPS
jgi:hypothetical protein